VPDDGLAASEALCAYLRARVEAWHLAVRIAEIAG
jgi:hypothetical protein